MPSISASNSSVLQRLTGRRQPSDDTPDDSSAPPLEALPEVERSRLHRRESSLLSLTNGVTDLGHNVKRSVSLRSHRTQGSGSSLGYKAKYPSSANLLAKSPPAASPLAQNAPLSHSEGALPPFSPYHETQSEQRPPRSRGKLSISSRSFSGKLKSAESLPTPTTSSHYNDASDPPPVPILEPSRTFPSMLAPALPRRAPPERPPLPTQASFPREVSTSHGSSNANGVAAPSNATVASITTTAGSPSAIYQTIHDTSMKRMATIDYFRKLHEGNVFYFGTLEYTTAALHSNIPSMHPAKLGRRATGYLFLGYSLPQLLELHSGSPLEYIKALSALLQEFETYQSLAGFDGSTSSSLSRARVGQMFKSSMGLGTRTGIRSGRRSSAATDSIALDTSRTNLLGIPHTVSDATSPVDNPSPISAGHDFHHLLTPHLPFDPDFGTVFTTLCDTLLDTYASLLGLVSSPEVCSPAVAEAFAKADKAIRKILVANTMREFEDSTRQGIKAEVAGVGRLVLGGLM
ncbi:hypothetical protein M433DRAFT_157577 [Acidomyces richmondensis BFW]|nr:MAG: hypothetical protein FE78DRAFT_84095 [Acidomyces sp. 'richmondensis']KYG42712.1 hypothetical protein M433DRAFT_157577 [Acidomyces richmondensis BFW]